MINYQRAVNCTEVVFLSYRKYLVVLKCESIFTKVKCVSCLACNQAFR